MTSNESLGAFTPVCCSSLSWNVSFVKNSDANLKLLFAKWEGAKGREEGEGKKGRDLSKGNPRADAIVLLGWHGATFCSLPMFAIRVHRGFKENASLIGHHCRLPTESPHFQEFNLSVPDGHG